MKIVYVHHCGSTGGAGNSLYFLLSKLVLEHEIYVITQQGEMVDKFKMLTPHVYEIRGLPVFFTMENFGYIRTIFVNLKSFFYYKEVSKVVAIIREIEPDIVHLNEIGMFSLAKRIKRRLHIPVVMHARTVPNRKHKFLLTFFTNQCNKFVDQLICITKSVAHQYPEILHKSVIYNPIQLDESQASQIRTINYDSQVFRVLFLANFYRQKGVDETLKAIIKLRANQNIQFVIIGSNIKSDAFFKSVVGRTLNFLNIYPDYENRIKKAVEKFDLKNITLLGQVRDIKSEIQNCHLLIAPMHLNGTPRSVFEAGIYGIPSILSLYHKIDDLVEHEVNGLVINEKSYKELVEGIVDLERDRSKMQAFGEAAKEKYVNICAQDLAAREMNKVYLKLIAK